MIFKNLYNSLNSLEYQYSVHIQFASAPFTYILTIKTRLHHRTKLKIDNERTFQRTLTHFISFEKCAHFNAPYFAKNVRNNYDGHSHEERTLGHAYSDTFKYTATDTGRDWNDNGNGQDITDAVTTTDMDSDMVTDTDMDSDMVTDTDMDSDMVTDTDMDSDMVTTTDMDSDTVTVTDTDMATYEHEH